MKTILMNILLAAVLIVGTAAPALAQGELHAAPHAFDSTVLTPAAPTLTRPLILDAAHKVHVVATLLWNDAAVTLISPAGTRYPLGPTSTGAIETFVSQRATGSNHHAVLTDPTPGTWQIEIVAHNLTSNRDVVIHTMFAPNPVVLALLGGGANVPSGVPSSVALAVFDGMTKLRDTTVEAAAYSPSGTRTPITFRDDGIFPDATANDGNYGASVATGDAGEYEVAVRVRGNASTGAFVRTATASFRAVARTAIFDGTFTDAGIDDNGDGLLDAVIVRPRLNVTRAGTYNVSLELRSTGGRTIVANFSGALGTGVVSPAVRFNAEDIVRDLGENGPYLVRLAEAKEHLPEGILTVDRRLDLGNTGAYTLTQFQRERLRLGSGTATGIDLNGNGRFDRLRIDLQLIAELSGFYQFSGTLTDRNGTVLGLSSGSRTFSPGTNTITLLFDGMKIGENGVDGPYTLSLIAFGAGQSLVAPRAFDANFLARQFEGYTLDTTPPVLGVSVTPSVLWPANHEMAEIVPTITVTDDQDPSPAVTLISVTSNEGDDVQGDGHTSDDVDVATGRIFLRAERSGLGNDRVYTLTWVARDAAGNSSTARATVTVPHDKRK